MERIAARLAHLLDLIARRVQHLVPKWCPVKGAFVGYHPARAWRVDAWREPRAWTLEVGRWELVVDLRGNLIR